MKKILLLVFIFLGYLSYCQTIPKSKGYVSDYENLFTVEQNSQLTKILTDYEKETTIEISVLTIPEFDSDIADFAQKTATEWGIGKKELNNGLLIVISKNKKVLRSQTGYGLEGYLPDGWLKHVGDSIGIKYKDNYYAGVVSFITKCQERIGKEGYSEEVNKKLIEKYKSKKEESLIEWLWKTIPWWVWIIIIGIWLIILVIDPGLAFQILFFAFMKGGSGSSGGGKFGGGGSSSKW